MPQEYNNTQGWSGEHVWAKSHGDFGTSKGVGTYARHLRPVDITVNSVKTKSKDYLHFSDKRIIQLNSLSLNQNSL